MFYEESHNFTSLSVLSNKLRCMAAIALENNGDLDSVKPKKMQSSLKKLNTKNGQQFLDSLVHMPRSNKIVMDYYGKDNDDASYEVSVTDFQNLVEKFSKEMFMVSSIKLAASGHLDMAWDEEKQEFIFRKGEKHGSSVERRAEDDKAEEQPKD